MSVYSIGVCRICKKSDCLKDGLCPICNAKKDMEEDGEILDILKEIFK